MLLLPMKLHAWCHWCRLFCCFVMWYNRDIHCQFGFIVCYIDHSEHLENSSFLPVAVWKFTLSNIGTSLNLSMIILRYGNTSIGTNRLWHDLKGSTTPKKQPTPIIRTTQKFATTTRSYGAHVVTLIVVAVFAFDGIDGLILLLTCTWHSSDCNSSVCGDIWHPRRLCPPWLVNFAKANVRPYSSEHQISICNCVL
jgi:hypothetical protein